MPGAEYCGVKDTCYFNNMPDVLCECQVTCPSNCNSTSYSVDTSSLLWPTEQSWLAVANKYHVMYALISN